MESERKYVIHFRNLFIIIIIIYRKYPIYKTIPCNIIIQQSTVMVKLC